MRNSFFPALLTICLLSAPSCSLMQPSTQSVSITATDSSAELSADGQVVGTGAVTLNLARNKTHSFTAKTADGRVASASVGKSLSQTGMLDIVGGILFLIPFIGLFAPGAWDLDTTSITLGLPQK